MPKTSAEDLYRLYNEENLSQREIGEKYGVGQAAVSNWMSELGVETDRAGKWSEEEKEILRQNYPGDREKLENRLERRTWNAIKLKAMDLGLAKDAEEHRNSDEVKEKLRDLARENEIDVDFGAKKSLSYVVGVVDGDGYHDNSGTVGLEVKDEEFSEKFVSNLEKLGLNPNTGNRRGKITVWASSQILVNWMQELQGSKIDWLNDEGDIWAYLEGQYDSDGNLHPSGSPRICSYSEEEKKLIKKLFAKVNLESNVQQNNVWVSKKSADRFFRNINPVLERRKR